MSVTLRAKQSANARMRQQTEDLLVIVRTAFKGGFYTDAARSAQHLKHVLESLAANEAEKDHVRS